MNRSPLGSVNMKFKLHVPVSVCTMEPGRTPGHELTPRGPAVGTSMSEQGRPPRVQSAPSAPVAGPVTGPSTEPMSPARAGVATPRMATATRSEIASRVRVMRKSYTR